MLVQHTLETVRRNHTSGVDREIEPVEKRKPRSRAILLGLKNDNGAAYSLYEKNGFRRDADDGKERIASDDDDDENWMVYMIE